MTTHRKPISPLGSGCEQHPDVAAYTLQQVIQQSRAAEDLTRHILNQLGQELTPGMTEQDFKQRTLELLKEKGSGVNWHAPYIRFGKNTILTFQDKATENQTLQADDIAFIDIGAILHDIEGDAGETYVFGNNPLFHDLKHQSEQIFRAGAHFWRIHRPTGVELYRYVNHLITQAGYTPNLDPAGHLIGSFPHQGWKEGLNHYPYVPEPGVWILEIQMRHPTQEVGSFYEAVLI